MGQFPVLLSDADGFCVDAGEPKAGGDTIRHLAVGCGMPKFSIVPLRSQGQGSLGLEPSDFVCTGAQLGAQLAVGACDGPEAYSTRFSVPSVAEVAMSTPAISSTSALYTLVEEEFP